MHITGMTVGPGSHPAFNENIALEFDERVNVFIGPNGCGKTSLLRVLASASHAEKSAIYPHDPFEIRLSEDWARSFENPPAGSSLAVHVKDMANDDFQLGTFGNLPAWLSMIPCVFIPATRITVPSEIDWDDQTLSNADKESLKQSIDWHDDAYIFDGRWVEKLYKFLHDDLKNKEDTSSFYKFLRTAGIAYSCVKGIAPEILGGRAWNYLSYKFDMLVSQEEWYDPLMSEPYIHPGMGVWAKNSPNGKFFREYVGSLSAGTQGPYLWILYIALKMMHHYELDIPHEWDYAFQAYERGWDNRPAILLIDEIENHLHPTWQRRVIPALLDHFPGLQIFATTHSPFVVAGLKKGQVHLLRRDADGVVKATTNNEAIEGWTADEILRVYMGVEHPTDEVTATAARDLRKLRDAGVRADAREEEERQAEILRLRRIVDRVELSGPRVAENERFLANLDAILERHIKSQSLNQENG